LMVGEEYRFIGVMAAPGTTGRDQASGFAQRTVAAREEGWSGGRGWGFAGLTVAGRDDGAVSGGGGFAQLTVAGRDDEGMDEDGFLFLRPVQQRNGDGGTASYRMQHNGHAISMQDSH
jgi:hypothetical protein